MRRAAVALALSLTCCGFPAVETAHDEPAVELDAAEAPALEGCAVSFTAPAELTEVVMWAAALWSDETGCAITVGAEGIPWVVLDEVYLLDGRRAKGRTVAAQVGEAIITLSVEMRRDMLTDHYGSTVALHEMGHALGGYSHLADGLLAEHPAEGATIDAASRAFVCERLSCSVR